MNGILVGLIFYFVVMLFIGLITQRYMKSLDDFLLGGRKLGPIVIAFSERASGESAWFILGLPGFAYATGMSVYWTVIGIALGVFLSWTLIALRLRRKTGEYNSLTIPDYLESRFRDNTKVLRGISALIIIIFYLVYLGAQFIGAGKILNATFGLNENLGMLVGAGIVVLYTVMGGFAAVALTDLVQGIIMLITAVILPLVGLIYIGGFGDLIHKLDPKFLHITGGNWGRDVLVGTVIGGMAVGLGYFGQPHLLTRYMAINDVKNIKKGVLIAVLWVLFAYWGAAFMGIIGKVMFPNLTDPEKVMPTMALTLFPPILAGFVISGAIAAMMSTADSQLLVVASSVVEDIYRKILGRETTNERFVFISRIITVLVAIVAFLMALFAKQIIYWLVLYAWSGLGASFGPPILLSLYSKKINKWGVLAGLISGTLTTIIWYNIPILKGTVYEMVPAFFVSLVLTYLVSILTHKVPQTNKTAI